MTKKIKAITNPRVREENLATIEVEKNFNSLEHKINIKLRYIADREIVKANDFAAFVNTLEEKKWESEEHLANHILHQFYDQILPHFVDVQLHSSNSTGHKVYLVKTQPSYQVSELLKPVLYPL